MNKIMLMGRLTRDPEVSYAQNESGTAVARFSIAVDRRFKREGEPDADFFNCVAFGKMAENIAKYFHKGDRMLVSGRIETSQYTNKDGQKATSVQIVVDEFDFIEPKREEETEELPFNLTL